MSTTEIKNLPIYNDIKVILDSDHKNVKQRITATIHTVVDTVTPMKLMTLDIVRDYVANMSDTGYVTFKMDLGMYLYDIYPYRENLEISIDIVPYTETQDTVGPTATKLTYRYKAVILPNEGDKYNFDVDSKKDDDKIVAKEILDVQFQLMDRSIEPLRIKTMYGIYRSVTVEDLLRSTIVHECSQILIDSKPCIDSIDIVSPDNTKVYPNIVIPHGTDVVELPTILQRKLTGVYTAGLGSYLQYYGNKHIWYIYPLYNTDRSTIKDDIAMIYDVPSQVIREVDKSYTLVGKQLKILANGTKNYIDDGESSLMSHGSGFRMSDAGSIMKKPIRILEDGTISGDRARQNYETVGQDRADGLNYAPVQQSPSSNPFSEYSKVLSRSVSRLDFTWTNSDPSLIYPGMTCKLIKYRDDKLIELNGTIVFSQSYTALQGDNINNDTYRTVTTLTLLIEPFRGSKTL